MSETDEIISDDLEAMIAQSERRQMALREHLRVAVQNWEVLAEDYTAHLKGLSDQIEQNGLVIHRLHSAKLGRAEPPMGPVEAKKERSTEQERLRDIWEGNGKGPPPPEQRTVPVTPPKHASVGEAFTTWTFLAGKDWSPNDKIDEKNVRHVIAATCKEGHFNPLNMPDGQCLTCKQPVDLETADRHYRLYDMVTGKLLGESEIMPVPAPPKDTGPDTENGISS